MSIVARSIKSITGSFVWGHRRRTVQMLLAFARTEAGGAVDISRAAQQTRDDELRRHFVRHAADEERHAEMFRTRARDVFGSAEGTMPQPEPVGVDLLPAGTTTERGSLSLTDHGFLPSDSFTEFGEVPYVAMLFLAEQQAAEDFSVHHRLSRRRDPASAAMFESILRDERYHVAYARAQLDKWRSEGRGAEVDKALRRMRWTRFKAQWVLVSFALGSGIGTLMMGLVYCTLFLPFGLLGRLTCAFARRGWRAPQGKVVSTLAALRQPA